MFHFPIYCFVSKFKKEKKKQLMGLLRSLKFNYNYLLLVMFYIACNKIQFVYGGRSTG